MRMDFVSWVLCALIAVLLVMVALGGTLYRLIE